MSSEVVLTHKIVNLSILKKVISFILLLNSRFLLTIKHVFDIG